MAAHSSSTKNVWFYTLGCKACSFCKVSIVRGPSRSLAFSEILEEVTRLRDGGYREVVLGLKERIPDFEFSVDVMAGFPGETEAQFANTRELLEILKPLKIHVFPYSRREGTRAAEWDTLPVAVVRDLVRRLTELAERISVKVRSRYLGRSVEILAEHADDRSGVSEGFTPNYLKVFLSTHGTCKGVSYRSN